MHWQNYKFIDKNMRKKMIPKKGTFLEKWKETNLLVFVSINFKRKATSKAKTM